MVAPFTYTAHPGRVLFGPGRLGDLGSELERVGADRALLLSTPEQVGLAERVASALGSAAGGIFSGAVMHTPVSVTEAALKELRRHDCDALVALGGGSTIGLGKALALRTGLPHLAIPTTYAGSEMTPILGESEGGRKTTRRTPKVLPQVVIYDVELTLTLPPALSGVSGMNAIAHAVEALYAPDTNPIVSLMAEEGIAALGRGLPVIVKTPEDLVARGHAQYGAWLCGSCLGAAAMGLHHKLCHVLGGRFDLKHAETHTVVLPHVAAFNAPAAPEALSRVARALGVADAGEGLFSLARHLGARRSLRELGMPKDGIEAAAADVVENAYGNPRPLDQPTVRTLLERAWNGDPPGQI